MVKPDAVVLHVPDWDEEACAEAEYQANQLVRSDPDAARDLRAMARSARQKLTGRISSGGASYDPMKLYACMAKFYGWSHSEMESMHFMTFFAYVREASEINEREKEEMDRAKRGHVTSPEELQGMFPEARVYEGETVAI